MTDPVMLPRRGGVRSDKIRMRDFGGQLAPPMGGEVQTLTRLGTRHAVDITLPTMPTEPNGREWSARLCLAKLYGVIAEFRQDGFDPGMPGMPVVAGAGQSGTVLALRGFAPGYAFKLGQAASLVQDGRRYLYRAAALAVAAADGTLVLPIFPMLRRITDDESAFEVARPLVQGSLAGNEVAWERLSSPFSNFGTITINEDA